MPVCHAPLGGRGRHGRHRAGLCLPEADSARLCGEDGDPGCLEGGRAWDIRGTPAQCGHVWRPRPHRPAMLRPLRGAGRGPPVHLVGGARGDAAPPAVPAWGGTSGKGGVLLGAAELQEEDGGVQTPQTMGVSSLGRLLRTPPWWGEVPPAEAGGRGRADLIWSGAVS